MAYAEQIPSQDPNKTEEEVDLECALAFSKMCRRERTAAQLAEEMGISRATFFRRIDKLILRLGRPSRTVMVAMEHEHLDGITGELLGRLPEASNADAARMVSVMAGLSRDRLSMYRDIPEEIDDATDELEDDDWEAR